MDNHTVLSALHRNIIEMWLRENSAKSALWSNLLPSFTNRIVVLQNRREQERGNNVPLKWIKRKSFFCCVRSATCLPGVPKKQPQIPINPANIVIEAHWKYQFRSRSNRSEYKNAVTWRTTSLLQCIGIGADVHSVVYPNEWRYCLFNFNGE